MIYLDEASTTKVLSEVIEVMSPYFKYNWQNPSSLYRPSTKIKTDINNARQKIADYIGATVDEIFFTSGGSESNNWVLQGFANYHLVNNNQCNIFYSNLEHKSIKDCIEKNISKRPNCKCYPIPNDKDGSINISQLNFIHNSCPFLVTIQTANNEIGTIQPIKKIAEYVHSKGGIMHTDAVQYFGQGILNVAENNIDCMSVSGHKFGCPKGIGFLYIKKEVQCYFSPLIYGSQNYGMRGGTENVPYIIGMAKGLDVLDKKNKDKVYDNLKMKSEYFISELKNIGCKLNGSTKHRLVNNINVTFSQNIEAESLLYMLDLSDIYASAGSACNTKSIIPSYVLQSIGLKDEDIVKTVRFTLPCDITENQIDFTIEKLKQIIKIMESK